MENTLISWTHHTANLWIGCQRVHEGCDFCYAEGLDNRWKGGHWGPHSNRKMVTSVWDNIKKFQVMAKAAGEIHRVFVGSMMDIFEKPFPVENSKGELITGITTSDIRNRFFEDVVPCCPNLQFLLLTKRPVNIKKYIPEHWIKQPPENIIYGYSAVNQETAKGIDDLVSVPGRHFLSMEPLLGNVDLSRWLYIPKLTSNEPTTSSSLIDWIIVGGESGNTKMIRPMHIDWARSIRDQAIAAGVPYHFKQWGNHEPDIFGQMKFVTQKDHKALLDGVEYKEFPI
jgi:protein gp37